MFFFLLTFLFILPKVKSNLVKLRLHLCLNKSFCYRFIGKSFFGKKVHLLRTVELTLTLSYRHKFKNQDNVQIGFESDRYRWVIGCFRKVSRKESRKKGKKKQKQVKNSLFSVFDPLASYIHFVFLVKALLGLLVYVCKSINK